MRYVALLRGINVGGNNLIRMADLKRCFEDDGHDDVSTYIASGNVLFTSNARSGTTLEARLERTLSKAFDYDAKVLVRSKAQIEKTLDAAPPGWPDANLRCNVVFVKAPLTPAAAARAARPKTTIDTVSTGPGVVYMGTIKTALVKSGLNKIASTPEYKRMTIRTFGTVSKIAERL